MDIQQQSDAFLTGLVKKSIVFLPTLCGKPQRGGDQNAQIVPVDFVKLG